MTSWQHELEARLLYAVIVAGKSAKFADQATARLWTYCQEGESPFDLIRRLAKSHTLLSVLRECRTGNYGKINRCFKELAGGWMDLNLRHCEPADLEKIHGIGPKTSRFFILWTRPEARYAALDVHILRWLRAQGYPAPRSTPVGKQYEQLEKAFLAEADSRGKTPRELDYEIWSAASGEIQATSGFPAGDVMTDSTCDTVSLTTS